MGPSSLKVFGKTLEIAAIGFFTDQMPFLSFRVSQHQMDTTVALIGNDVLITTLLTFQNFP